MHQKRVRIGAICAILVGLSVLAIEAAEGQHRPCDQIKAACRSAGFVPGGAAGGYGLKLDCINPIMQGIAQASRRLPQVDPRIVTACQARNPRFGQSKTQPLSQSNPQRLSQSKPPSPGVGEQRTQASPTPTTVQRAQQQPLSSSTKRPNIVFILTDDFSSDLVKYMPNVLEMQKQGATFTNYFVTNSLCCPSRASIFTGRYPHNSGIFKNKGPKGGHAAFRDRGLEQATFATALSAVGYRTAMLGKYLNMYQPENPVPPGWTTWAVAGNAYRNYNYSLNQDGKVIHYGNKPTDYMTDVLSNIAARFINQSAGAPFLIEVATFTPHRPPVPAPRDANALPGLRAPRTPAFNAGPDATAVSWLRALPVLSTTEMAAIDEEYRMRAQSVLAIDKMIGDLRAAVAAIGEENNTYFVFSSDNGYHMGEYRLLPGKMTAYDIDIHVPLIVTGPGVPAGLVIDEITQNIDLHPTFTEIGGAPAAAGVNGRSLVPLLQGQKLADWRTVALIEHHGPVRRDPTDPDAVGLDEGSAGARGPKAGRYGLRNGNPTTYKALRSQTCVYIEYTSGEKEYHDLTADPHQLRNTFSSLSSAEKASLHATLQAVQNCHDARSCQAAERPTLSASER